MNIILQVARGGHYLRKSHCVLEMACETEMASCVRGYHIYKDIWVAAIGEVLVCFHFVKLYLHKYFRMFSAYENIFKTKKS